MLFADNYNVFLNDNRILLPEKLSRQIFQKKSFLCVGLDTDLDRIPEFLHREDDPVFEFNRRIIEATQEVAVAYKPNLAFYEAMGPAGWVSLQKTLEVIPDDIFVIADAKRGDIGNTSRKYAEAFFLRYDFDALTIAPYMGMDSVRPFLEYEDKWVFLLALTSNEGGKDFQYLGDERPLYEEVLLTSAQWAKDMPGHLGYVVGATRPQELKKIRSLMSQQWFLIPGVGAQGGSLSEVAEASLTERGEILINSSRGIIYAGNGLDFDIKAGEKARSLQQEMSLFFEQ